MENNTLKNLLKKLRDPQTMTSVFLGLIFVVLLIIVGSVIFSTRKIATTQPSPTPEIVKAPTPVDSKTDINTVDLENGFPFDYTVGQGDSLWSVAQKFYKSGFGKTYIEQANNLKVDQALEVGQKLTIPKLTDEQKASLADLDSKAKVIEQQKAKTVVKKAPAAKNNLYVVRKGDSLWKISKNQLGSGYKWPGVYKINRRTIGPNPNLIYPQQRLHLR